MGNKSKAYTRSDAIWQFSENVSSLAEVFDQYRDLDKTAFIFHGQELSFKELHILSDHMAAGLIRQGVGRGKTAALRMKRSLEAAISIAAVLKSGAALLPLDMSWPDEMIKEVCQAGQVSFMIDENNYEELVSCTLPFAAVPSDGDDIVTMLFTSGSTGRPKGVIGTNRNYLSSLLPHPDNLGFYYRDNEELIFLNTLSYSFMAGILSYYHTMISGNTMIIADEEESISASALADRMLSVQNLEIMFSPANLIKYMEDPSFCRGLSHVRQITLCWGIVPAGLFDMVRPYTDARFLTHYGSTETNGPMAEAVCMPGQNSVGMPTWNTKIWILDEKGRELPGGEQGEICISGPRVTPGYIGDEDRNAEVFEDCPDRGRLLHMGDIGYINADGQLVLAGRKDSMVKLRGFRVEPGQVEAAALSCPGIGTAACKLLEADGESWLALYYTKEKKPGEPDKVPEKKVSEEKLKAGQEVSRKELEDYLYKKLPYYMIPSAFVLLDHLPLTDHQKIDYRALPFAKKGSGMAEYQAPSGEKEKILCEEAGHILKAFRPVSVTDTWFSAGGSSLSATRLVQALRKRGYALPVSELFGRNTFRDLAVRMRGETNEPVSAPGQPYFERDTDREEFYKLIENKTGLPADQVESVIKINGFQKVFAIDRYYNKKELVAAPVILVNHAFTEETFTRRTEQLISRHPALRSFLLRKEDFDFYLLTKKQGVADCFYRDITYLADQNSQGRISKKQERYISAYRSLQRKRQEESGADLAPHFFCMRVDEESCAVGLVISHIIADGLSVSLLLKELGDRENPKSGQDHYYSWLRASRQPLPAKGKTFWEGYLTEGEYSIIPATGSDTGFPDSGSYELVLSEEKYALVREYCRIRGVSPTTGLTYIAGQALLEVYGLKQYLIRMMFGCRETIDFAEDVIGMLAVNRPVLIRMGQTMEDYCSQIRDIIRYPCPEETPIEDILLRTGFRENSFGITDMTQADKGLEFLFEAFSNGNRRLHDFVLNLKGCKAGVKMIFDYDSDYQSEEAVKKYADCIMNKIDNMENIL